VFVALLSSIKYACALLSFVACPALELSLSVLLSYKWHGFLKTVTEHKMCGLTFYTTFAWNIFPSRKNWARYDKKCVVVFMWSTHYSSPILMKLEFSRQLFEKYKNIKLHENSSSWSRVFSRRHADRKEEANSCYSQFCEHDKKVHLSKANGFPFSEILYLFINIG